MKIMMHRSARRRARPRCGSPWPSSASRAVTARRCRAAEPAAVRAAARAKRPPTQIPMLKEVGIDQKLDAQLPLDAAFVDDDRPATSRSASTSATRPVVLALVYYECPMLCTQVLNGLAGSLAGADVHRRPGVRRRRRQLRSGRDAGDGRGKRKKHSCAATAATGGDAEHPLPDRAARRRSRR